MNNHINLLDYQVSKLLFVFYFKLLKLETWKKWITRIYSVCLHILEKRFNKDLFSTKLVRFLNVAMLWWEFVMLFKFLVQLFVVSILQVCGSSLRIHSISWILTQSSLNVLKHPHTFGSFFFFWKFFLLSILGAFVIM